MDESKTLRFAFKDKLLNADVTPGNVSLPMLSDFIKEVSMFLRGTSRISLNEISTSIEEGSVTLKVYDETGALDSAFEDYRTVKQTRDLSQIDPQRANILRQWHEATIANDERSYSLGFELPDAPLDQLRIDENTEFIELKELWVDVELYVYGRVFDMGGKSSTNVHIELDNGKSLTASTKPSVLIGDNENRLYRKQLLRIRADQNLDTMELRNETLISFEYYHPVIDEDKFEDIAENVRSAWNSVHDVNQWVEELRGSSA